MNNIILILLLTVVIYPLNSSASSTTNDNAIIYFEAAKYALEEKEFENAIFAANKAENILGKGNALISSIKIKSFFELKQFKKAKVEVKRFYNFKHSKSLSKEVSSYILKIDKGLEFERMKEKKIKREHDEKVRVAQEAREAENQRLANQEKQKKINKCKQELLENKLQEIKLLGLNSMEQTNAPITANKVQNQAKAYYMQAEDKFYNKNYMDALSAINKTEDLLGKGNAVSSALKVQIYFEQGKLDTTYNELKRFFGFKSRKELSDSMENYFRKTFDSQNSVYHSVCD